MIKVGIIGFGKMGQIRYNAVKENGQGAVVGMFDPVLEGNWNGCRLFRTAEELINDDQIEAVFVCTPNHLNKSLTIQALQAGKHVFCEKPPAFTAQDMSEIMDVEKISGKKLMYGFNHRHHDSVIQIKQIVDSEKYGKLLWMRGRYGKSVDQSFYSDWRSKKELSGGGILIDQGIHMLDLFLMLAGNFDEVSAFVSNLYWKLDVEDNVFAILRNKNGVVASLHSTMTQWRHLFSLEIFLEHGYIVLNGLLTSSGAYGRETMTIAKNRTTAPAATWSDEEHRYFDINNSWNYEVKQFFDSIQNNTPVRIGNSIDAYKLMKIIDKIYENPIHTRSEHEREGVVV